VSEQVETFLIQVVKKKNDQTTSLRLDALLRSVLERGNLIEVVSISPTNKKTEKKAN
jgi:hypothetical protein